MLRAATRYKHALFARIDRDRLRQRLLLTQLIAAPVGLVVLAWLLVDELPMDRIGANAGGVLAGIVVGLIGLVVFGARLHLMARLFGIAVSRHDTWRVHLVSLFYYFFLPAGVGYDLVRVAKLGGAGTNVTGWKLAGVASVERIAGGAGLAVLLLLALPFTKMAEDARLAILEPPFEVWAAAVAAAAAVAGVVYVLGRRRYPRLRLLYPAGGLSALAYALVAAGIWIAAEALGIRISSTEILVALAATLLFQLIPVNLLGVSFGEVAAVAVYGAYGLARPEAVFLTTIAYLQRLAAALLGGGVEVGHSARSLLHIRNNRRAAGE